MKLYRYTKNFNNMLKSKKKQTKWIQSSKINKFDPNGSYTGTSIIGDSEPIQDADDL